MPSHLFKLSSHLSCDTEILNISDTPAANYLWAYDISISNNCLLGFLLCHPVAAPSLARRSTPAAPITAFVFITTKVASTAALSEYLVNVGLFSGPLQLRLFGASDCLELTRRERILCIYGYPRCTRAHLLFKNSNARQWLLSRLFWECSTSARLLVPWSCCLIDIYLDLVVNGIVSGLVNNPIG